MDNDSISRLERESAICECELERDMAKPWGGYLNLSKRNEVCTPKLLIIKPYEELSLQLHKNRKEMWFLTEGKVNVYRGKLIYGDIEKTIARLKVTSLIPGDSISIPAETIHTAVNISDLPASIVEISLGYAEESDILRLYDKYNRTKLEGYPEGLSIKDLIPLCRAKF